MQSDYLENNLVIVVRKPQDGKTFICIHSIAEDSSKDVHIVLTMNTLAAGMQFFGRMEEKINPENIIVFNSNKKTAGKCIHAKTVPDIRAKLRDNVNIKVIVCCAHRKRFADSLFELFDDMGDTISFTGLKRKFKLHIDEAHKYIPENRDYIRTLNSCSMVSKIIGYSASPDPIFTTDPDDCLFNRIYICDVEKEYGMIRSNDYFGVKDCQPNIIENKRNDDSLYDPKFNESIPIHIINFSLSMKEREKGINKNNNWFGAEFPFHIGNEKLYLGYLIDVLKDLLLKPDQFSYHFIPSYKRKVTHYQTAECILQLYNTANVIIINGNGIQLFRYQYTENQEWVMKLIKTGNQLNVDNAFNEEIKKQLLEPSFVIQLLILNYPNCPTFVTGMDCVGMSVTLVNKTLGNFDNIIIAHQHYKKEDLYQLCRFLFNYTHWSEKERKEIKKTKFISLKQEVYDICLGYESYIENMQTEFAGKTCELSKDRSIKIAPKTFAQQKREMLLTLKPEWGWKKFQIEDADEEHVDLQYKSAMNFYKRQMGHYPSERSQPSIYPDDPRFKICALTGKLQIFTTAEIEAKINGKDAWYSYFQLVPGQLKYATRILIGYEIPTDPTRYTLYIKWVTLQNTPETLRILEMYTKSRVALDIKKENVV